jgi:Bacterial Ig-like domain
MRTIARLAVASAFIGACGLPIGAQDRQSVALENGMLVVRIEPAAALYIDGTLVNDKAADEQQALAPGPHRLMIVHADYENLRRTVTVIPRETTTVTLKLADKAIRKPPPPPAGRGGRGRGAAPPPVLVVSPITDPDVTQGAQFVSEGDFDPAAATLLAAERNLAGVPRSYAQQALAYLYLGVALNELERVDQAKRAFALAQRTDKTLTPKATEFSAEILSLWRDARTITTVDDSDLDPPVPVPPPTIDPPVAPPDHKAEERPDIEFITTTPTATTLAFVTGANAACAGSLTLDRERKVAQWTPTSGTCAPEFAAPFAELRSPAAAPHGGLLLQFRSDRPSMVLMPAGDADLLDSSIERTNLNDLPADTKVHMRVAHRAMMDALGRPFSGSLFGMLVEVPLAELAENSADYDGGSVRTRGALKVTSATKGPWAIAEEGVSLQLAPSARTTMTLKAKSAEWRDTEVVVSGMFSRPPMSSVRSSRNQPAESSPFVIQLSGIEPADEIKYSGRARQTTIEDLVKNPPPTRELVRVIGKYRGKNTFGDMQFGSYKTPSDWIIKDETFSVWVTDKRPSGKGFSLEAGSASDYASWVAVTGTVEERKGFVYLRATDVEVSGPPSETSKVVTPPARSGAARTPPDIRFVTPTEDVEEADRDQQFLIQFTKPMDEASFAGHVQLRYAGDRTTTFPRMSVNYYLERTFSIIIDPGVALRSGQTIECVLLPGIKDVDNLPLIPAGGAPRVLKWKVR